MQKWQPIKQFLHATVRPNEDEIINRLLSKPENVQLSTAPSNHARIKRKYRRYFAQLYARSIFMRQVHRDFDLLRMNGHDLKICQMSLYQLNRVKITMKRLKLWEMIRKRYGSSLCMCVCVLGNLQRTTGTMYVNIGGMLVANSPRLRGG